MIGAASGSGEPAFERLRAARLTQISSGSLDPKGRFEVDEDGGRVRAVYGHSVDVDLADAGEPAHPDALYHGTAPGNLDAIREEGLKPMDRQSVHLSPDRATALEVGRRHAEDPVVLRVDAAALREAGIEVRRRSATVYTCPRVPPEALSVDEPGPGADPDAPADPNT